MTRQQFLDLRVKLIRENASIDETARQLRAALDRAKAPPAPTEEQEIGAALDQVHARRYPGDAAELLAIAASESLDKAKLIWWIKDAHAGKEWTPAALKAWCAKYGELLSHLSQPPP